MTITDSDRLLLQGVRLFGVRRTLDDIDTHEGTQGWVRAAQRLRALAHDPVAIALDPVACRYIRSTQRGA